MTKQAIRTGIAEQQLKHVVLLVHALQGTLLPKTQQVSKLLLCIRSCVRHSSCCAPHVFALSSRCRLKRDALLRRKVAPLLRQALHHLAPAKLSFIILRSHAISFRPAVPSVAAGASSDAPCSAGRPLHHAARLSFININVAGKNKLGLVRANSTPTGWAAAAFSWTVPTAYRLL